ncbi:MAG: hypothetical protein HY907_02155 [Deltaproteobacteria bacterium]|nr:hypothetical protein [Deltaproteobacteria bacterium]
MRTLAALDALLLLSACSSPSSSPDAAAEVAEDGVPEDADGVPDGVPDGEAGDVEEFEDSSPPPLRALLLDYDILHPDAWIDLHDALAAADVPLDYRRWYPHLTAADTIGEDAYGIVFLAAGLSPGTASAEMSLVEVDTAAAFVRSGGLLVLVPWPGYLDTTTGENEWFLFNRILETLGAPLRIDKALLVGPIFGLDPAWPHQDSDEGYATSLEFDVGYGWLRVNDASPVVEGMDGLLAAGRTTTTRTSGGRIETWAMAFPGQSLWQRLDPSSTQMRGVIRDTAAVVVAEADGGLVAVVPKGFLTVGGANGMVSHQPVLQPERIDTNRVFLANAMRRLAELRRGAPLEPNNPAPDQRLFATRAPGFPPITTSDEEISIAYAPHRVEVPDAPPAGDHLATFSIPASEVPDVPLFPLGRGTLGFGSVPADPADVDVRLAEAAAMGLDTLMMTITPEQLVTGDLSAADADALRARIADIADRAEAAGVTWTVGMYYSGYAFNNHDAEWPWSVGPQGQRIRQPAAAEVRYWDEVLMPAVVEVATIAATHPGIAGIEIDMETYGGALWYPDLQCFDDESFQVYLDGLSDDALRDELAGVAQRGRLDALLWHGLLRGYVEALSAHVEAAARRMEEAAHALAPDFVFIPYAPIFSSAWFYRAVGAGLATPDLPVVWLSYDTLTARQRESWVADGIPTLHLGGVILGNFDPDGLETGLRSGLSHADGFWLFSFDELSDTVAADPPHGTRAAYRAAVAAACAAR